MITVKIKEVNDLYDVVAVYDDCTGEKLGEYIGIPQDQIN